MLCKQIIRKTIDAFYRRIGCYIIKRDTTYKVTKTQLTSSKIY